MRQLLAVVGATLGALLSSVLIFTSVSASDAEQLSTAAHAVMAQSGQMTLTIAGLPPAPIKPATPGSRRMPGRLEVITAGPVAAPAYYFVQPVDTLYSIAQTLGVDPQALMDANGMKRADTMEPGFLLRIPGPDGLLPPWATADVASDGTVTPIARKSPFDRMTPSARAVGPESPYYKKTWITYYGRPLIPFMGIVGAHDPISITQLIKEKAAEYDAANGPQLGVQPAVHLVWGMATVDDQPDNSHIAYLTEEEVMPYIEAGLEAGVAVILDSQIANLSASASISPGLPYLKYPNVHLAIDPEFAVSYPGQAIPGTPIGFLTAAQVNETQQVMADYMRANGIEGKRVLMVHQFQSDMIVDKENLDATFPEVELTLSVDGFGNPYVKTWKYNALVDETTPFTSFKLFYDWDDPLMTPREAMGVDATEHTDFIEITPNMIQYQ